MRLPDILYDQPVQKRGRYASKASQITLQTAQMEARSMREEGALISGAERGGGELISNAMRNAAQSTSQTELAAEKRKNDKIAEYSFQAAKFDIESTLAGDLLQIKEERDKYIIDREYERDLSILGTKAGLARAENAIKAAAAWKKLDINNQLKLQILDIRSDEAWKQTFIKAATSLAQTAWSAFTANQNAKYEAEISESASQYEMDTARVEADLSAPMFDIDDPKYESLDLDSKLPQKVLDNANTVTLPDGRTARTVPTHEVGELVYRLKSEELRGEALANIDSAAHRNSLETKLENVDSKRMIKLLGTVEEHARNWDAGLFQKAFDDAVKMGNLDGPNGAIAVAQDAQKVGSWSPQRSAQAIKDANVTVKYGNFLNRIDGASTDAILDNIKGEVTRSGLPETRINQLRTAIEGRSNTLEDMTSAGLYRAASDELISQRGIVSDLELRKEMVSQAKTAGLDDSAADALGDKLIGDLNQAHASDARVKSEVTAEAKPFLDNNQRVPEEIMSRLDRDDPVRKSMERANKQIDKHGYILNKDNIKKDIDSMAYGSQGQDSQEKWAKDWLQNNGRDKVVDALTAADIKTYDEKALKILDPNRLSSTGTITESDKRFSSRAKQVYGKDFENRTDTTESDAMLHRINREIVQIAERQQAPATPDQVNDVIRRAYSQDVVQIEKGKPKFYDEGKYTRQTGKPTDIGTVMGDTMYSATKVLEQRDVNITNKSLLAVRREAIMEFVKQNPNQPVTDAAINQMMSQGARIAAAAEGAGYLEQVGKAPSKANLEKLYTQTENALRSNGISTGFGNITTIIDLAARHNKTIDQVAKDAAEYLRRREAR